MKLKPKILLCAVAFATAPTLTCGLIGCSTNSNQNSSTIDTITSCVISFSSQSPSTEKPVILSGQTIQTIKSGKIFATLVPPQAVVDSFVFKHWSFKNSSGEYEEILPSYTITSDMVLYPIFEPKIPDYCVVTFDTTGCQLVSGSTETIVRYNTPFSKVNKPVVKCVDEQVESWRIDSGTVPTYITQDITIKPDPKNWSPEQTGAAFGIHALSSSTLKVNKLAKKDSDNFCDLQYSKDYGVTWSSLSEGSSVSISSGTNLYLKGNNAFLGNSETNYTNICLTGNCNINGNVMGLLDNGTCSLKIIDTSYCFYKLFENSTGINKINSDFLPATKTKDYCYAYMFSGCNYIKEQPSFSPTGSPYCFSHMFMKCTSLESAKIPASSNEGSHEYMYQNCSNLKNISYCSLYSYKNSFSNMFENCTSLTSAANIRFGSRYFEECSCYQMFKGCSNLKTPPSLSLGQPSLGHHSSFWFGNSSCYQMFYNCSSLEKGMTFPYSWEEKKIIIITYDAYYSYITTSAGDYCCYQMYYNCPKIALYKDSTTHIQYEFIDSTAETLCLFNDPGNTTVGVDSFYEMFGGVSGRELITPVFSTDVEIYEWFYID